MCLCTDKTGTLTQDKIVLERHTDVFGTESSEVLDYAYLNSYHQTGLKNLLDVAVLEHVELQRKLNVTRQFQQDRRSSLRFPAPPHVGDGLGTRRPALADLQRRGRRDTFGLRDGEDARRRRSPYRSKSWRRCGS